MKIKLEVIPVGGGQPGLSVRFNDKEVKFIDICLGTGLRDRLATEIEEAIRMAYRQGRFDGNLIGLVLAFVTGWLLG